MKRKFEIVKIEESKQGIDKSLSAIDYLETINDNRNRIRSFASQLSSICGMLLSASFVIIFFLIKESYDGLLILPIYILMFSGVIMLINTLVFSILSSSIPKPKAISSIGEKLENQLMIYTKEYRRLKIGQWSLLISIFCFLVGLILFIIELNN